MRNPITLEYGCGCKYDFAVWYTDELNVKYGKSDNDLMSLSYLSLCNKHRDSIWPKLMKS